MRVIVKWLVGTLLAVGVLGGAGVEYVSHHPALVLRTLASAAGPGVLTPYLHQHPLSFTAHPLTPGPHLVVRVKATGSPALANVVGRAVATAVPPVFHISPQALAQMPAFLRSALGLSQGPATVTIGTLTVVQAAGSVQHGTATLSAPITVNGQPYILSATVDVTHDALTGVSALQLVP